MAPAKQHIYVRPVNRLGFLLAVAVTPSIHPSIRHVTGETEKKAKQCKPSRAKQRNEWVKRESLLTNELGLLLLCRLEWKV